MTEAIQQLVFYDSMLLKKTTFTDEGFLKTDAVVTRAGVYPYRMADGKIVNQFRPPEEVFSDETMASMKMLPVTNNHPVERLVTADTAKDLSVGFLGETVTRDNATDMRVSMRVTDSKTIEEIKSGTKRQLSSGYTAELHEQKGSFEGKDYTHVQRNIRGNHVAVVKAGRMGKEAAIMMDSADAVQVLITDNNNEGNLQMSENLKTILLDSIEYKASPEVINAFDKMKTEINQASDSLKKSQSLIDEKTAECDSLKLENDDLKKKDINVDIMDAVDKRLALLSTVKAAFGDDILKKVEKMNDHDIKVASLEPLYKDVASFNDKKENDVYIDSLFEATLVAKQNAAFAAQKIAVKGNDSASDGINSIKGAKLDNFSKRLGGEE